MTWLLRFLPSSGRLFAIGGAIIAGLLAVWRVLAMVKKSGVDQQKVEEAKARDRDLQRIKDAAAAGARVRPDDGGMQHDPFNRDK